MADDYSEQTGQPGDTNDDGQRRRMMEFILRSALKPSIPPSNPAGNDAPSLLKRPNTQGRRTTGATPTNALGTSPQNPIEKQFTRPSTPRDVERFGGSDVSLDNDELIRRAGGMSSDTPVTPRLGTPPASRPNVPSPRATDTTAPDINANAPWTQSSGKRVLGMGAGTPLLGLERGPQPARPDVMPTRADFPAKPVPTWQKVLGVAAAPFAPAVTGALLGGPRREAERQYQGAVGDWERGQQDEVRQAQLRNINSEIEQRGKPKPATTAFEAWQQQNPNAPIGDWLKLEQGTKEQGKQPSLGPANISQINDMHTQRYQVLNPNKPLPPALTLRPGSTQADYDRIDKNLTQMESAQGTQAQRESTNAFRQDAAAQRAKDREDRREEKFGAPVYAYDPNTKQTILTTQGAAKKNNLQAVRKVSQPDIEKDTDKLRQIGDAQMNVSAYRASLTGMNALSGNDLARVGALIGDDKFKLHFMGLEIPVDWYNQLRDNQKFNDLPEDAKDAVVGYIGARGSIIAYTTAISGTGRLTETQLQTEMQNLPKPTDPPDVAEKKFARFQRNIDQAASGLPKIPGIDTPAEIRAKTEVIRPSAQPPAQPKTAAPKGVRDRLVNFLNQKMGAQ